MSLLNLLVISLTAPFLVEADNITIMDDKLRVEDVVDFGEDGASTKDLVGDHVLLEFLNGTRQQTYTAEQLQSLIRRRIPGLSVKDTFDDPEREIQILLRPDPAPQTQIIKKCFRTRQDLKPGQAITHRRVAQTDCTPSLTPQAVYYDRANSALRAHSNIPVGEYLGPIAPVADTFIDHGTDLHYNVQIGPVLIERRVTTLQSGHVGEQIFAHSKDGTVLKSVLLSEAMQ